MKKGIICGTKYQEITKKLYMQMKEYVLESRDGSFSIHFPFSNSVACISKRSMRYSRPLNLKMKNHWKINSFLIIFLSKSYVKGGDCDCKSLEKERLKCYKLDFHILFFSLGRSMKFPKLVVALTVQ